MLVWHGVISAYNSFFEKHGFPSVRLRSDHFCRCKTDAGWHARNVAHLSTAPLPLPTVCPHPVGWIVYVLQSGDEIQSLAAHADFRSGHSQHNCLVSTTLLPDTQIFLPPC
jgi:hypothetical protein